VFTLARPSATAIEKQISAAGGLPCVAPRILSFDKKENPHVRLPFGFARDFSQSCPGHGDVAFMAAKLAFARWSMFDLGWARVANPEASITPGQIVAVEVHSLGLWSLNLSRVVEAVDTPNRFGLVYSTTQMHVEEGEELFLLEFDPATGQVSYQLEAVSRPRNLLARLGFPITRAFQHRFARDSHQRMLDKTRSPS
jgi:uncharacterized protein (UPF0548 family)